MTKSVSEQTFTSVMYHYVRDLKRSRYPSIKGLSVEGFKGQLQYIKQHYHVLCMEECIAAFQSGRALPPDSLLLTFDDGFIDHFTVVFPILLNEGLTGAFYPPGQAIAEGKVLDVHKIHFILASVDDTEALLTSTFASLDKHRDSAVGAVPSNDALWSELAESTRLDPKEIIFIKRLLQHRLPAEMRAQITQELFARHVTSDESAFAAELYMSPDQMQAMFHHGMAFGSHGWRHVWLNTLSEKEQADDIDRSLQFLRDSGIWTPNWSMSYPYGGHNDTTVSLLAQRGCAMAFTVEVEMSDPNRDGPLRLARFDTIDLPTDPDAAAPAELVRGS